MRSLTDIEIAEVSGANPIVIGIGRFVVARVTGKAAGNVAASAPVEVFINAEIAKRNCSDGVAFVSSSGYSCL